MSGEELIRACAEGIDDAAWDEFVSRFHRPISLSITRIAYQWSELPQQVVDDLVQDTYLKLCANQCRPLLQFAIQHPDAILGYIKTIAVNVVHDHFRSLHSKRRGAGAIDQIVDDSEVTAAKNIAHEQETMEREILLQQINHCLESCSEGPDQERDRTIFWLYYQQGMSARDIAALRTIGLSAKGVESAIFRLTRLVREQLVSMKTPTGSKSPREEKGFLPAGPY